MILLKFGGSVITDKTTECCFKQPTVDQLAKELFQAQKSFILVHGAGSFGHIQAKKYHLNNGYSTKSQLKGFSLTHMMVQKLNSMVLNTLYDHGIPAVGLPPHAMMILDNHQPLQFNTTIIDNYLDLGLTPVTYGDVILDKSQGFSICSGDLLIEILAKQYHPDKVIFVMDEDGLFTANPKLNPDAKFITETTIKELSSLQTTANTYADVTKGMQGKVETIKRIAAHGIDTYLVNGNIHNRLFHTLIDKETKYTHIFGDTI
ncbi:MAG: isopentenyl phosphate kinase family protein [Candidatus Thermoplasmatota archaeon]|nr:isopentenyl phosphate kinase family protein [Candidatus Thermoplasmatota archaeon]MBU1941723.1 isopentenyl phosphate kinase family protein [Candidatus Thermoplasmatota archaeon]